MYTKQILYILLALLLAVFAAGGLYNALAIRYYTVSMGENGPRRTGRIRIALITDLHSCRYGKGQKKLLDAIDSQAPDIICMSGDIFDDKLPDGNTEVFISEITKKYPCRYVTGNHEYWSGKDAFDRKMGILERYGVKRLSGECETVEINGITVNICGVDDRQNYMISHETDEEGADGGFRSMPEQIEDAAALADNGNYTILLAHRPEYCEMYAGYGFDLALCGHAHGGQWRIPGIMNGFFAPNQGLFPKYAGGYYEIRSADNIMTMIVSRGLARESTIIPRFYNRPEVVIVDLV